MKPRHELSARDSAIRPSEIIPHSRSRASVHGNKGLKIERDIVIDRPAVELFAFWRNFENLPRVMKHLVSVKCFNTHHSHWRMCRAGDEVVEWDAEIINEHLNELIAWRTLEGSDVQHAGSVRFTPTPDGRSTELKLTLEYEVEGGLLKQLLARIFRATPEHEIEEDLLRFKTFMEQDESVISE